jgi:hypothetical protein
VTTCLKKDQRPKNTILNSYAEKKPWASIVENLFLIKLSSHIWNQHNNCDFFIPIMVCFKRNKIYLILGLYAVFKITSVARSLTKSVKNLYLGLWGLKSLWSAPIPSIADLWKSKHVQIWGCLRTVQHWHAEWTPNMDIQRGNAA